MCSSETERLLESEKGVKVLKLKERRERLIKQLNDHSESDRVKERLRNLCKKKETWKKISSE